MSQEDHSSKLNPALADAEQSHKPSLSKRLLNKTLNKTREAVNFAADTTGDLMGVVGQATNLTLGAIDHVTNQTKNSVLGVGQMSANAVREIVSDANEAARNVALHAARTFLGKTALTLYLPEMILNNQIRKRINLAEIDDIRIDCGNDRFQIEVDGHYKRFLYRLTLKFDVLECRVGQEKFLRLRQTDESLDLQIRHGGTLANWATRRIGKVGFEIINRIPIVTLINHIIRDIPGIQQERHRLWYIDLEKAGFIDFINNRSWMVDKLLNLTDFSILPGLNILRESTELVRQLVDQFEICGLRVQSNRLEVQVRISADSDKDSVLDLIKS